MGAYARKRGQADNYAVVFSAEAPFFPTLLIRGWGKIFEIGDSLSFCPGQSLDVELGKLHLNASQPNED